MRELQASQVHSGIKGLFGEPFFLNDRQKPQSRRGSFNRGTSFNPRSVTLVATSGQIELGQTSTVMATAYRVKFQGGFAFGMKAHISQATSGGARTTGARGSGPSGNVVKVLCRFRTAFGAAV